jgi:UDPglucose--hexose-1-phosphate uridylyltransferase
VSTGGTLSGGSDATSGAVHERELRKPDGRHLTLYSRRPIPEGLVARSPRPDPVGANPHLRWHPLRREWVTYAAYRQGRTFLPPPEYNPLLATDDPANPTELPAGDYDIAVFDNLFPALALGAHDPPSSIVPTLPADGHCEVVVFSQEPKGSLGALPVDHLALLLDVWGRRTAAIAARGPQVRYVLPFENRGAEVGVTLHHPHGQIFAYPFVPPVPARVHESEVLYLREHGEPLLESLIAAEEADGARVLYADAHAVAFLPAWARYPYEVWVAPRRRRAGFSDLDDAERLAVARALKHVLQGYDALWNLPFPYILAWYQAPLDDAYAGACHLHAELYPAYRMQGRLKFLAGTEIAAGLFASDALPEEKAAELRAACERAASP